MTPVKGKTLFFGLMRTQLLTLLVLAVMTVMAVSTQAAIAVAWGAGICWLAHAWAGFQMWLHPKNADPRRQATVAIRAEVGKIAIALLLLWLSLKTTPELRNKEGAAALLLGFFITQVAGWIWLARATSAPIEHDVENKHDG